MSERPGLLNRLAQGPVGPAVVQATERHPAAPASLGEARFRAPTSAIRVLPRVQLLQRLEQSTSRLVLIRAPGGFGKSTLLAQYHERCLAAGRVALWVNLLSADNDPEHLALLLMHELQKLDGTSPDEEEASSPGVLLERLAQRPEPLLLFLDEFEVLRNSLALELVRQVLDVLPAGSQLLLASRETPALRLGQLRARGQLLEIDAEALRFSLEETRTLLRENRNLNLLDAELEILQERTEGWITALHLASLSLQDRRDPGAFVASFSGSNLELAEYLTEDILSRLDSESRHFLLQTSLLERFCAPLCDALSGRADSAAMIERLQRANLFLFPLDSNNQWFRYHPLFTGFLRNLLERQDPGQALALHREAAHWHFQAHLPLAAIGHLLHTGDHAEVAAQLNAHLDELVDTGRYRTLLRFLDQVPSALIDRYPQLIVTHAWTLLLDRRYAQAMRIIERHPVSLETESIRCLLLAFTDQIEATCAMGPGQFRQLPKGEPFQRGLVGNALAYCLVAMGRYDEAREVLAEMVGNSHGAGLVLMSTIANCIEGVIELTRGHLSEARERMLSATGRPHRDASGQWLAGRITMNIFRAVTLYEADLVDEVRRALDEIPGSAMDSGGPDAVINNRVLLARLALLRGERASWQHHLAYLEQLGRHSGSSRMLYATWVERARIACLEGRFDIAEQALRSAQFNSAWEHPDLLLYSCDVDTLFIGRQRLRIARGEAGRALQELPGAIAAAEQRQQHRRALKLQLLLALALAADGAQEEALTSLTPALRLASYEGFRRTFLDEGPAMTRLLQEWAVVHLTGCSELGVAPDFISDLLHRASEPGIIETAGPLSPRELEVLRLLAAGNRNLAIAEKLNLSLHTVKTHLRNISTKLGAQGRTAAVAIARARRLID
ncbi:LuxR C-terminal-related transcriptional regulator [Pseudomonas nitroreducens]|uniref:LuxR C-terminal-related transcriptional regulator n=1 Tax=Pseudomonas nitroreducens TaxID=46680 RepID=UPI003CC83837